MAPKLVWSRVKSLHTNENSQLEHQGCHNPKKQITFQDLWNGIKPSIVLIQESKLKKIQDHRFQKKIWIMVNFL